MIRSAKPKLSLNIATAVAPATARPSLSLSTTVPTPRTPVSPSPMSPTALNTRMNKRGFASTISQPLSSSSTSSVSSVSSTYSYTNQCSSKSILKRGPNSRSPGKRLQFSGEPTIYCVTPIDNKEDYYGPHVKMSRDEKRWRSH